MSDTERVDRTLRKQIKGLGPLRANARELERLSDECHRMILGAREYEEAQQGRGSLWVRFGAALAKALRADEYLGPALRATAGMLVTTAGTVQHQLRYPDMFRERDVEFARKALARAKAVIEEVREYAPEALEGFELP